MPTVKKEKTVYVPQGTTLAELAAEVKPLIARKKELTAEVEELEAAIHMLLVKTIPAKMEKLDTDGTNIKGVGYLELNTILYPYVKVEDREKFYGWLEERGDRHIVKEAINPKTLQAFVTEQDEAGTEFPEYVTISRVPTAVLKAEKKR